MAEENRPASAESNAIANPSSAKPAELASADQAAVLLMALGEEYAAEILKHLAPRELHLVGAAMANLSNINRSQISDVVKVFNQQLDGLTSMGIHSEDYIRSVLVRALGRDKAKGVLDSVFSSGDVTGVDTLKWMDSDAIAGGLQHEHPQVLALVLASLEPQQAAEVLGLLPEEIRHDAIIRVASLDGISGQALEELNDLIEKQVLGKISEATTSKLGGPKRAADILNLLASDVEGPIMDKIKELDGELGKQVEELMVIFDALIDVDDRGVQALLREVSTERLVVALRGADEVLKQKIFDNMSKRAAQLLKDDLEVMAPVRLSEVEEAQREIMNIAKRLADDGQLTLGGGGEKFV